ncbi:BRCT domain-containing protein [Aspergillus californicus]
MAGIAISNKEHPLAGVVLCFTSILPEQRTELATIASQMGASNKYDLTSDVTHLIVGDTNTPKYKFVARERPDILVLKPEWVESVRQSWMQGGDTDIHALEEHYKLPTFTGTAICITGFDDMALRNYIRTNAQMHGSDFRGDLTKTVTHLIARVAEGEKYKFATQWNVKVVTLKWFNDSMERGMALEETSYHPLVPSEQQGASAWNRSQPSVKQKLPESENMLNPRPRKLRRIASAKLGDQNENIWGDIVGMGFETAEPKPSREDRQAAFEKKSRDASVIQIAKSFASGTTFAAPSQPHEQPVEPIAKRRDGFLDECFFLIHGFSSKQAKVLRHHLPFNGAQLVDSLGEFSRPEIPKRGHSLYIIVPYNTPKSEVLSTDDLAFECEVVTDMWLERCLDAKALVSPDSHIANTPIPSFPLNGFSEMKICSTGFSRIDLLHLSKLVGLVGATYHEYLTPKATVLLCNQSTSINPEKLRHTNEWGVPAVTADWLWNSIRLEKKQPYGPYSMRRQSTPASKDLEVRAGSRTEQILRPKRTPEDNTALQQSINVPNKSKTPDPVSASAGKTTQAITESPQKPPINPNQILEQPRKSRSPTKPTPENINKSPSAKRKLSDEQHKPITSTKSALDQAVTGLLKQARVANPRATSDNALGEYDRTRSRRPKPLLGRAQSNSSARASEQKGFSRASSIDTLNEDGCGSAIESIHTDSGIPSLGNGNSSRFEFEYPEGSRERAEVEEETPPMTQLDYEDPDAVAMREKFLRYAGKFVEKPANKQQLIVGEVRDLEQSGWGTGRRTRNAHKVHREEDDEF